MWSLPSQQIVDMLLGLRAIMCVNFSVQKIDWNFFLSHRQLREREREWLTHTENARIRVKTWWWCKVLNVLWKVKSSGMKCFWDEVVDEVKSNEVVLLLWWKLWISEGAMYQGGMIIRSRSRKIKVTLSINYSIYIIL